MNETHSSHRQKSDRISELIDAALDQPAPTEHLTEALNDVLRAMAHPLKQSVPQTSKEAEG